MALLKDQPISCLSDWISYDSKVSILSEQESTSIESKSRLAQNEIETQITNVLIGQSGLGDAMARQLIDKVVVTEPLSRWHSLLTLSLFYIDIAVLQNSPLHREQSKYLEIKAETAKHQLFESGVGLVNSPIPKAPLPLIVSTPAANLQRILRGRIRFVDEEGKFGSPSAEFLLDMADGASLQLSIATLPSRCVGWLLFAGDSSDSLYQANLNPVPAGIEFDLSSALPLPNANLMVSTAQFPDRYIRYSTEMWR